MQMFCSCAVSFCSLLEEGGVRGGTQVRGGVRGGGTPPGGPLGSRNYVHEIRQASFVVESPSSKSDYRQTDTMEEIPTSPKP